MGYTNPATRITDYNVTAADWNAELVDNIRFLYKPPRVALHHSAAQTIVTGVRTTLTFNSEHFDTDTMHDAANPTRITFTTGGAYVVSFAVSFTANATGLREVLLRYNGASDLYGKKIGASPAEGTYLSGSFPAREYGAGTFVELQVRHTAGVDLDVAVIEGSPSFAAHFVGGL